MNDFEIGAVVVCDEIRKEITQKDLLIGVYAGDIVVPQFPIWINVAVWMEVMPKKLGEEQMRMRISLGGKAIEVNVQLTINAMTTTAVVLTGLQMHTEATADLVIELQDGSDWKVLKRKKVLLGQVTFPYGQLPPVALPPGQ